jgi:hypothetical protein
MAFSNSPHWLNTVVLVSRAERRREEERGGERKREEERGGEGKEMRRGSEERGGEEERRGRELGGTYEGQHGRSCVGIRGAPQICVVLLLIAIQGERSSENGKKSPKRK